MADACAKPYCECTGDEVCLGFLGCIAEGGDDPGLDWYELCWQQFPGAVSMAGRMAVCAGEKCAVPCMADPVDACLACQYQQCPTEINKCLSLVDCRELLKCLAQCKQEAMPDVCATSCLTEEYPGGVQTAQALDTCVDKYCAEPCTP
jgi:hypothetical protein